jgi:hypothetical protein
MLRLSLSVGIYHSCDISFMSLFGFSLPLLNRAREIE